MIDPALARLIGVVLGSGTVGSLIGIALASFNRGKGVRFDQSAAVGFLIGAAFGAFFGIFESMLGRI